LKLLLDTHIWIWSFQDSRRLGKRVLSELRNPDNELWLSPISTWEALLLNRKNRLQLPTDIKSWLMRATAPMREAPLTHEIARASEELLLTHGDPADRFLAATAQVLGLTLVTADRQLLGLGNIATLANR
jgi:PIN domain nuclease of toxin-antitoxin system